MGKPNSMRHLDNALRRACGGSTSEYVRARTMMANAIVGSMLPDGVIKGGSAIKMRFGDAETRFTIDLDAATPTAPEEYAMRLNDALAQGWEGFSGRVVPRSPAMPEGVPEEYVMQPFDVKLTFAGKPWCTVPLELSHNEIGDADSPDWMEAPEIAKLFELVGLPSPGEAPLMTLEYQVGQKLHAVSGRGDRARDLVDLQLIMAKGNVDLVETKRICERLFLYRKEQAWPPVVKVKPGWNFLYAEQASGLPVLQEVEEAVGWVNDLIRKIDGENANCDSDSCA